MKNCFFREVISLVILKIQDYTLQRCSAKYSYFLSFEPALYANGNFHASNFTIPFCYTMWILAKM